MRLDTTLSQRMEQRQFLAPRMIQSMEILQLPVMALQERIEQELQENPVLELKEADDASGSSEGSDTGSGEINLTDAVSSPATEDGAAQDAAEFERLEAFSRDWEDHLSEEHRPSRNGVDEEGDRKHDAMQNMPSRPQSLQDYLNDQLAFFDPGPEQLVLLRLLITYIDEKGWLTAALEEIARASVPPVTIAQVEEALQIIQKLDPPGVGARDLKECLLLQLGPETRHRELVRLLIVNHLEDIQHNRLPNIQKRTGLDLNTIREGIEVITHLNPRPGAAFTVEGVPYVVPDIIVEQNENGEFTVRLLDDWVPNVYISRRYIELYRDKAADPVAREYLKRKIQAAQWLLESIEQRRNTLERVTKAIIHHQRSFLEKGTEYIEPLKMQQIADQVKVHVTTVSRAVDDKWVQTPRGIFPLKRFFGGGTQTQSGEEVAYEKIKHKLLELVEKEDKANPLSDEELVARLKETGYPVARRTVTKYRKMLDIPSSRQRKEWTG